MKLMEFLNNSRGRSSYLQMNKIFNSIIFSSFIIAIIFSTSCDESLPGLVRDDMLIEYDSTITLAKALDWRTSQPDNGNDHILYFGQDENVRCFSLARYDLSNFSLDTLNQDSLIEVYLELNTADQLWQGTDDSAAIDLVVSSFDNSLSWSESDYSQVNYNEYSGEEITTHTIPDTMTNSGYLEVDLPLDKVAGLITGETELNFNLHAGDTQGPIQSFYSSEYGSYLQLMVGFRDDTGDTLYAQIDPSEDVAVTEYLNQSEIDDSPMLSEGLESYFVLPVEIDTSFGKNTIISEARLELEIGEVVDYNVGMPLAVTDVDSEFVLADIDSSIRSIRYAYSGDSSVTMDVRSFVQSAMEEGKAKFQFAIWCEDNAHDFVRFFLSERKYDLKIMTINQKIEN